MSGNDDLYHGHAATLISGFMTLLPSVEQNTKSLRTKQRTASYMGDITDGLSANNGHGISFHLFSDCALFYLKFTASVSHVFKIIFEYDKWNENN